MSYEHNAHIEYPLEGGMHNGGVHAHPYRRPGDGYGDGWHPIHMGDADGNSRELYPRPIRNPYDDYREGPVRG